VKAVFVCFKCHVTLCREHALKSHRKSTNNVKHSTVNILQYQSDVRNMIEMLLEKVSGHWLSKLNYLIATERQIYVKVYTYENNQTKSSIEGFQEYQKMLIYQN